MERPAIDPHPECPVLAALKNARVHAFMTFIISFFRRAEFWFDRKAGGWRLESGGSRLEDQGWRIKVGGSRLEDQGWRIKVGGSRLEDQGWRIKVGGSR